MSGAPADPTPLAQVELAERTTFQVGGPARHWLEVRNDQEVVRALQWASERDLPVEVIGGGSNVLIADGGLDALVVRVCGDALTAQPSDDDLLVEVGAGMRWDALVAWAVEQDAAGLECLAGIPGDVGAAPIQNVGAYGQEVSEVIEQVHVVDRTSGAAVDLDAHSCGFGYRDSIFKREADGRYVVTRVRLRLRRGGEATVAYPELARALGDERPSLARVRDKVVELRRAKSMVLDVDDDNHRSAGSFFVNPTVSAGELAAITERVAKRVGAEAKMPHYPAASDEAGERIKLSAAWLIERAGMTRGTTRGQVGISTRHSLAIVNRGGASAKDIIAFAAEVRACVREAFGVTLTPEPRMLGFELAELAGLYD